MSATVIRCALSDLLLADLSVSVVFCYDGRLDETRLAAGFERALAEVPVFAGHLRERGHELEIVCDGTGASYSAHDVALNLSDAISRLTLPGSGLVDDVDAAAARAGNGPVLTVRVNRLADGTTMLGCSWHHALGDMSSFMAFMRAWSNAADGEMATRGSSVTPTIVTDREAFLDDLLPEKDSGRPGFRVVEPAQAARLAELAASSRLANRLMQVYFGEEELARLRDRFAQEAGCHVSKSDALIAHLVGTIRTLDHDEAARYLTVPVDLRQRLSAPEGVIGNLLGEVHLRCPGQIPPSRLAAELRTAVADFATEHLSLRTSRALLTELAPGGLANCVPLGFDSENRTFTVSSWRGFGAYDITFGGHAPVLFSPAISLPLPWVSWVTEGFDGRGTLCTVSVPAHLAPKLRAPAGRALLHSDRDATDPLPPLASSLRKIL
jgi:hypothetical protein